MEGFFNFLEGFFAVLSGGFALLLLPTIMCVLWHFGSMRLRKRQGPSENQVLLGGAIFTLFCLSAWVLLGVASIGAGAVAD